MNEDELTIAEAAEEMREIALKFFRGHNADYRQGYKEGGLLARLEELREFLHEQSELARTLQQLE
jgi:hypothetical protein